MGKELKKGCVVFMKASSGLVGYGNAQCVREVHHETISLYGHNQHFNTYDIDRVVEHPDAELQAENATLKWHDVNDILPAQGQYCYVYIPSVNTKTTFKGWYRAGNKVWHTTLKSHASTNKVTHWQVFTLPTLKGQKDDNNTIT